MHIDLDKIKKLPPDIKKDFMKMYVKLDEKKKILKVKDDFLSFAKHMWPDFIEGEHHKIIADKFNQIAQGKIKRLIVNMPPRHTKSEFASSLLPAWMIGRNPKLKIIQTTHTGELAIRFGRKAKTLMDRGDLVPDKVVIDMISSKLDNNTNAIGFIFDGFPRTTAQAESLDVLLVDKGTSISAMLSLKVEDEELIRRLLERGKDSGRADDQNEGIIANRINEYNNKTAPLKAYYDAQNKLSEIEGVGSIADIAEKLNAVIDTL